jgi:hypothetical protein
MNRSQKFVCRLLALSLLIAPLNLPLLAQEQTSKPAQAWTAEEALAQLELYPQDSYLQYVALQLARRENKTSEIAGRLERILFGGSSLFGATDRRASIDLFSVFTGALAVQESLQLDTMRGGGIRARFAAGSGEAETAPDAVRQAEVVPAPTEPAPEAVAQPEEVVIEPQRKPRGKGKKRTARKPVTKKTQPTVSEEPPQIPAAVEAPPSEPARKSEEEKRQALEARRKEIVSVASLTGPTVQSHPWEKMLAGRRPELSPLADYVPEDFYFVEFRSLSKLLEAADQGDLWSTHLFNQAYREARTHNIGERIKEQLALDSSSALRPFYDLVIEDVAITGSDLFLREGSDVTLVFRVKQPDIFRSRLESFTASAEKSRPDAKRTSGNYLGVDYTQLATPERELSVITAWLAPNVCVRGNSLQAMQRVIAAFKGQTAEGATAQPLAKTTEFAYIRTLMPRGAREEDGFVYLSDPFIRRMVGPQLKLTERRRMICYNHLRMLGHAALLYLTENGKKPDSIGALAEANCSPGLFGQDELVCPDGGKYSLSADGMTGRCSHHSNARFMTPNLEIPVTQVNGAEADEYNAFLKDYNQYWRMFFDPIALRLKVSAKQYRLETIVLPLIDNSIYTGLATVFGGKPEPLDALPVPQRNIFSLGLRLNKEKLLEELEKSGLTSQAESLTKDLGVDIDKKAQADFLELLKDGIGNQIGLHLYDAAPMFDLNFPALMGMVMASSTRRSRSDGFGDFLGIAIGFGVALLNTPVYASIPLKDTQRVDEFLKFYESTAAASTRKLQRGSAFFGIETDYYGYPITADKAADAPLIHAFALRFGPVKLRAFAARIGNAFYIASKPFILEDLYALEKSGTKGNSDAVGHAMLRIRANNWKDILSDYRLGWAENQREACLNNLGVLSSTGRAYLAQNPTTASGEETGRAIHQYANKMHAVQFFCPEGGKYQLALDNKTIKCSIHGDALTPRQGAAPLRDSSLDKLMHSFAGATATLEFKEEGLRAVVTIDRK